MVVQHNISAMTANRYYGVNNKGLASSLEKLASGYAINKAGDNAAGLAVSEKMRAQIGGLTQASKNAEDGISMVQTFEGALQETDSILQRMRTLAVQSANGSYQDEVDREAIQLEFNQLNDELDQIADTDYNGVIVLNGGEMADGLKQVAGKFDYKANAATVAANNAAQKKTLEDQLAAMQTPEVKGLSTVDDVAYTKSAADNVWEDLGLDASKVDELHITFTADADGNFTATKITDKDGNELEDVDLSKITASNTTRADSTGDGGFKISTANASNFANAIFDATEVNEGDVVGIKLTNTADKSYAPKNVGFTDNSADTLNGIVETNGDAKIELAAGITDSAMNADWKTVLDKLGAATINVSYGAGSQGANSTATSSISDTTTFTLNSTSGKITLTSAVGGLAAGTEVATFTKDTGAKLLQTTTAATDATYGIKIENYNVADPTKVPDAAESDKAAVDMEAFNAKKTDIQNKIDALGKAEAGKVSKSNAFDQATRNLTYTDNITLQVGARTKDAVNFTFSYDTEAMGDLKANMNCSSRTDGLGTADLSLLTAQDANNAIDKIDDALNKVNMVRATFGAIQNRLEHKISNIDTNTENMTAAESRIRDTQMDKEMMKFTSSQILSQASQSMLAQANQLPQGVLQLLG